MGTAALCRGAKRLSENMGLVEKCEEKEYRSISGAERSNEMEKEAFVQREVHSTGETANVRVLEDEEDVETAGQRRD